MSSIRFWNRIEFSTLKFGKKNGIDIIVSKVIVRVYLNILSSYKVMNNVYSWMLFVATDVYVF